MSEEKQNTTAEIQHLKNEDFGYVFVFKHADEWSQLPPPCNQEKIARSIPKALSVFISIFTLTLKKTLGLP